MSKHNNVNPDHYKVAGREKPGTPLGPAQENKEAFARQRTQERAWTPGNAPAAPRENRKK